MISLRAHDLPLGTRPTDNIFLFPNCTVGGWLLHDPSFALRTDGSSVIAYSARDISAGGVTTTDLGEPA